MYLLGSSPCGFAERGSWKRAHFALSHYAFVSRAGFFFFFYEKKGVLVLCVLQVFFVITRDIFVTSIYDVCF